MARKKAASTPALPLSGSLEEAEKVLRAMTKEERAALRRPLLAQLARVEDSPRAFAAFYELIYGNKLPAHGMQWINRIYGAHEEGIGSLIWAWRGSWKSTTISVAFLSYRIGKEPYHTNLIIGANDDSAEKITAAIALIIENNAGWKLVFPNVVPDDKRGWGAEGYFVKDTSLEYSQFLEKCPNKIDPMLVGGGYKASRLIGKHPTGVLLIDDIHDERNSSSDRNRAEVVKIVSDTILPMAVKDNERLITWEIAVGTPWAEDDAYHYLKNTGQMDFIAIPVMEKAEEGDPDAVYVDGVNRDGLTFPDIVGWWKMTWPEMFGPKAIIRERATAGLRGFARMFLLDLKAAKVHGLRYFTFPHQNIDPRWPAGGGCDLATVIKKKLVDDPGRDYFSLAYGLKDPLNRLIVMDGIFEQCTQAQAEEHLKKPQSIFTNWRNTVIEGDGAGETFYVALMLRNPGLRLHMMKTGGKSKQHRQERELGPWLETAMVLISDADTPYLNALRKALDDFPEGNNDIRDGLYWLCRGFPETLKMPEERDELPQVGAQSGKANNPFAKMGRWGSKTCLNG
jgi:hypothetical protein